MKYYRKRILVIGGAGFIGSHLVDCLIDEEPEAIFVVDNMFLGRKENLAEAFRRYPKLKFYKFDATDGKNLRRLIRKDKIGIIFNLATKPIGYSFVDPTEACLLNIQIISHLLESLRYGEIQHLIHFSTSEVYGDGINKHMREDHPLNPHTTYAAGKAGADLLIRSYEESFGVRVLIIRPFNNYGPRQNEGLYAAVIPITMKKLLEGESPIIAGDGMQTRDFINVFDTVRVTLDLAKKEKLYGKVINVATGKETSIREIVFNLCRIAGFDIDKIEKGPLRPGDVRRHCADISLLRSIEKNLSLKTLEEGLAETWEWYTQSG